MERDEYPVTAYHGQGMFDWFYKRVVPPWHRAYLQQHPLAFWVSLGWLVAGLAQIVAVSRPGWFQGAIAVYLMPEWIQFIFAAMYTIGGGLAAFGIACGKRRYEAAGMTVLSAVLFAWLCASVYLRHWSAIPTSLFLIFNSIGCLRRAHVLVSRGYDNDYWAGLSDLPDTLKPRR